MEYKKQSIETALLAIEPEKFQELCDCILQEEVAEYAYFVRTGSKPGKRKTQKGTPDTAFKLPNGKWLLVETTTQEKKENTKAFLQKLEGDIQKCLTKFSPKKIEKILLCTNAKVLPAEYGQLSKLLEPHGIQLEIKGLDVWAGFLAGRYQYLTSDYLGLPLTNWQVTSLKQFLAGYQKTGFQPGLNNQFYAREKELGELKKAMIEHPFVVVKGKQGLGKSKLCVEAIRQFLQENSGWGCFCITNPTSFESVFKELQTLLYPDRNYILLLDDANRHRQQLYDTLAFARQERAGKIHVVATVRDYAASSLLNGFAEFAPKPITIDALEKEALLEILRSPDFKIRNDAYQRPILRLAQGNVRILVMLAQLAIEKQDPNVFKNVAEVYDKHFNRVQEDCELLKQSNTLKVLGLLSFFYTIDMEHGESFNELLRIFKLKEEDFRQVIEQLHEQEFIELSEDRQVAKSADQSLASYVFFRVFIRDGLLPFADLLFNYFWTLRNKVSSAVISANNDFDLEVVREKITPYLRQFWKTIGNDERNLLDFFDAFWYYLKDECLAFIAEKIEQLPIVENPVFETKEKDNNQLNVEDKYILQLDDFLRYNHFQPYFSTALELGFDYVSRKPESMPEWFKTLTSRLAFTKEDRLHMFERNQSFWEFFSNCCKAGKSAHTSMISGITAHFLRTSYTVRANGISRNEISFYEFYLPDTKEIRALRASVWDLLQVQFARHPTLCFNALKQYPHFEHPVNKWVYEFDLPFLLEVIENCLDATAFPHCFYVHETARLFSRMGISSDAFERMKGHFMGKSYRYFHILDRNFIRGRADYELDFGIKKFNRLKNEEIFANFQFADFPSFLEFYETYKMLVGSPEAQHSSINESLDHLFVEHFSRNPALTFDFIEHLLKGGNPLWQHPGLITKTIATSNPDDAKKLLRLLQQYEFDNKGSWLLWLLENVPEAWIDAEYYDTMMGFLDNGPTPLRFLDLGFLEKLKPQNPKVFWDFLRIVSSKPEQGKGTYSLWYDFFEKQLHHFEDADLPMLKQVYFTCEKQDRHFDFSHKGWLALVKRDTGFALEYFSQKLAINPYRGGSEHRKFGVVWEFEQAETIVEGVLQKIMELELPFGRPFFSNANELFNGFPSEQKRRIETFLLSLIDKYAGNLRMMEMAFNVVRHGFKDLYEAAFIRLLELNADLEFFAEIPWGNEVKITVRSGNVNWSEIEVERWRRVQGFLDKFPKPITVLKHKAFVNDQIDKAEKAARRERRHQFEDDY